MINYDEKRMILDKYISFKGLLRIILAKSYWVVTKIPSNLAVAATLLLKTDTVDKSVYKV